jgi:hypothetical protein
MGGENGGEKWGPARARGGAEAGAGDHSARAVEPGRGRAAQDRGGALGVRYGGAWATPGERGPTREKKRSGPSPDEQ